MQTPSDETVIPHTPVYYRWRDERSPLIVELKIDLVPRIVADLQAAEELGMEGGGVLVGCFPKTAGPPLLRIEEFEAVGRRGGDGLPYVLVAEQRQRFTTVRKKVATRELSAIGYFRSHLRTGPLELSVGDRDLMSAEFRSSIHVALLIAKVQFGAAANVEGGPATLEGAAATLAKDRRLATYFVSVNGIIQNRVDPATFPFEVADLEKVSLTQPKPQLESRLLPAQEGGPTGTDLHPPVPGLVARAVRQERRVTEPIGVRPTRGRIRVLAWAGVGFLALLTLLFAVWGWQQQGRVSFGSSTRLELSVTTQESGASGNQSLHVTWNHESPLLSNATKAVLTISDRATHRTIQEFELAPSDLTAGSVKVDMEAQPVEINLVLWMADSTRVSQVAQPSS